MCRPSLPAVGEVDGIKIALHSRANLIVARRHPAVIS
jgi:hypothetical protein